jgi:HNH endonuclease
MNVGEFWELGHVADGELESELRRLLASGSRTEAGVLAHLAAVEERRLHLEAGSSSLFHYCCARLGLSESEAFHRLTAARLARRFPLIFAMIARREIHLSGVCLLRDFLTPENHRELLAEAAGKTKLQVQELLARRFPRPDVASRIRKLPDTRAATQSPAAVEYPTVATERVPIKHVESGLAKDQQTATQVTSGELVVPSPRIQGARGVSRGRAIEPLSAARYRIQLSASAHLKEKLDLAVDLLSHSNPSGDLAAVIERALDLLIEQTQKRRFAQTKRPRRDGARPTNDNDAVKNRTIGFRRRRGHVPNATKRQIVARDGLRCTYVSAGGERCSETKFTQVHHERPWARGGGETPDNLRMLCAAHNRWLAEEDFGTELVATRVVERRGEARNRHGGP